MDQKQIQDKLERIQREVNQVIRGKENGVERVLAAIISGGHILMEDIPGVGKTTLATTFAKALSMNYKRVQFTPDVLPSDILGFSMYDAGSRQFVYRPGAVFCNLFLADEINRTSPKTQSALLEVMEENHATVDGVTRPLPNPMGYPEHQDAVAILKGESADLLSKVQPVLSAEELCALRSTSETIFVHDSIYDYIVDLVEETRKNDLFEMGASPRATIALLRISRAMAMIAGRDFVTAADVQKVLRDVLGHRVRLSARTRAERITVDQAMEQLVQTVKAPRM